MSFTQLHCAKEAAIMAINPMKLLQFKDRYRLMMKQHPKLGPFFSSVMKSAAKEGSVLEFKVTTPEGKEHVCNIRLTDEDVKTISMLSELRK